MGDIKIRHGNTEDDILWSVTGQPRLIDRADQLPRFFTVLDRGNVGFISIPSVAGIEGNRADYTARIYEFTLLS